MKVVRVPGQSTLYNDDRHPGKLTQIKFKEGVPGKLRRWSGGYVPTEHVWAMHSSVMELVNGEESSTRGGLEAER